VFGTAEQRGGEEAVQSQLDNGGRKRGFSELLESIGGREGKEGLGKGGLRKEEKKKVSDKDQKAGRDYGKLRRRRGRGKSASANWRGGRPGWSEKGLGSTITQKSHVPLPKGRYSYPSKDEGKGLSKARGHLQEKRVSLP